jgi:hypothetical protein
MSKLVAQQDAETVLLVRRRCNVGGAFRVETAEGSGKDLMSAFDES